MANPQMAAANGSFVRQLLREKQPQFSGQLEAAADQADMELAAASAAAGEIELEAG